MRIGQLAKRLGVATSKIRFYESAGLMGAIQRQENGFRRYDEQSFLRLSFIRDAQRAGLDLDSIRQLIGRESALPKSERAQRTLLKELQGRLAAVDGLQQQLKRQKIELQAAIAQLQAQLPQAADQASSTTHQQSLL